MPSSSLSPLEVFGPRMQIAARRGDVGVAERGLHLGEGGATIERMRPMSVAQPMRRDGIGNTSPLRRALKHVTDRALGQPAAALVRGKDRIVRAGIAAEG